MELLQIIDEDGSDLGLVQTDMIESELKKALEVIDPSDEHGMSEFEKFEEHADDIGKSCTRFYIDGVINL